MSTQLENSSVDRSRASRLDLLRRWMLACLGVVCVGVGAIGAVVPGLPTTIFLMAACYLFAKSCPRLETLLVQNRFFAPFHQYLDGTATLPWSTRAVTLIVMWVCILISTWMLWVSAHAPFLVVLLIPVAGVVGSYFIANGNRSRLRTEKM